MSSSTVVAHLKNSIVAYAADAANNTKGFISLEHDLTSQTVNVAKSLIPFGKEHNLQIMSVANCLHDASPYGVANNTAVVSPPINTSPINTPPINTPPPPPPAPVNPIAQGAGLDLASYRNAAAGQKKAAAAAAVWSSGIVLGSIVVAAGLALL